MRRQLLVPFISCVCMLAGASHIRAQDDTTRIVVDTARAAGGWGSPRVLELISRATTRRARPLADTALHNYRATAEGFVYFFLDRESTEERTLVRVHQIGLELYWRQPGEARQRIAGMRDASPLPNTQRYHLDHLTMVQNGFGDIIRMGDGDEVRDVVHPASVRARGVYEYRLADSRELRMGSMPEPLRVYEVQVRPVRTDRPGFVGSIFIDRSTADIIRMTFTFTPSSYVDKRLDYINISLDNGLWEGRYWLPNEQTVEIRRQVPELDFVAGSVIRGRMHITDFELNATIPDSIFRERRMVVAFPEEQLRSYKFEKELFEDVDLQGLSQPPEMAELRREAARLIGRRLMSGLPSLRFFYPDVSSAIRYNRTDGLYLGLGAAYEAGPPWRVEGSLGYAFGSRRGSTLARVIHSNGAAALALSGYTHSLRDLGPVTALPGVANTLSAAVLGEDFTDPWFATGGALAYSRPGPLGTRSRIMLAAEQQKNASNMENAPLLNHGADFRSLRAIEPGNDYSLTASLERAAPASATFGWSGALSVTGATFDASSTADDSDAYMRALLRTSIVASTPTHSRELHAVVASSFVTRGAPAQQYFLAGGQGTLPGYGYRAFAGRSGVIANAELTQRVVYPWLGVRVVAAAAATGALTPNPASASWDVTTTDGIRTSAGAGLALFWDLLHVDAVKGLNGGKWVLHFSFTRSLDDIS